MSEDAHRRTAALMFEVTEAEVDAGQRRLGKALNGAVAMRVSAEELSLLLGITEHEAVQLRDRFCATVLGVTQPGGAIPADEVRRIAGVQ